MQPWSQVPWSDSMSYLLSPFAANLNKISPSQVTCRQYALEGRIVTNWPNHVRASRAVMSNNALLTDAYLALRASSGAANRER